MEKTLVDTVGGRKNILGYIYLGCVTFLVNAMLIAGREPDFIGMATVIGAMSAGLGAIVWGNIKEHQSNGNGNGKKEEVKS